MIDTRPATVNGAGTRSLEFMRQSSAVGPSLKARVLMALAGIEATPVEDLLAGFMDQMPPEFALDGSNGQRGLLKLALRELDSEGKLAVRAGVVRLVAPEPDPRFAIDPGFRDLLPPPTPGELSALERKLVIEGCCESLRTWTGVGGRTLLVDGHHRQEVFGRHRMPFTLSPLDLPDRQAVEGWIWENNYGRRNFTPEAKSYACGRQFNGRKLNHGGDRRSPGASQGAMLSKTAQAVARLFGVSRAKVFRDGAYARDLDRIAEVCGPELRTAALRRTVILGRGRAQLLAGKGTEEMRELAAQLLAGKKVKLRQGKAGGLFLPAGTLHEKAQALVGKLGKTEAAGFRKELARVLRDAE